MSEPVTVYAAMARAAQEISAVAKSLRNEQAGYAARSIDDVLDAVHQPLADAGLVLVPVVLQRITEERRSSQGKPLFHVAVEVRFSIHGPDGEAIHPIYWGEAMDSGDKATNKAMSAALKMCLIQTFTIPVAGDDADRTTHDVAPSPAGPRATAAALDECARRLADLQERVGRKAYPSAWRTAGLPSISDLRRSGTVEQVAQGIAILVEADQVLTASDPTTEPEPAAEEPCAVCGLYGDEHEDGCPNGDGA